MVQTPVFAPLQETERWQASRYWLALSGVAGAVDARHRHHVAGGEGVEHFEKLAPVVVCAQGTCPYQGLALFGRAGQQISNRWRMLARLTLGGSSIGRGRYPVVSTTGLPHREPPDDDKGAQRSVRYSH